jgi:hypothetical protein
MTPNPTFSGDRPHPSVAEGGLDCSDVVRVLSPEEDGQGPIAHEAKRGESTEPTIALAAAEQEVAGMREQLEGRRCD